MDSKISQWTSSENNENNFSFDLFKFYLPAEISFRPQENKPQIKERPEELCLGCWIWTSSKYILVWNRTKFSHNNLVKLKTFNSSELN